MPLPPTDIKILIADDLAMMRKITLDILTSLGYMNVAEVSNGAETLEKLQKENFDLLILDWNMPEMDGLQVLKAIRSNEKLKNLPVLMVTGESDKDMVIEAIRSGVTDYIVKPFKPLTLKKKLETIFK